ncbi:hypothetical protein [Nonomuraea jiangxiensis]|uniref:Acyltransferase family protein n=1 Tax=Nonomuraea jiangxiensis TaxID=633440 RepID=A0A1G9BBS5_9ACTN|nr:hypothetical protein [Nonomuraea jiangxiensis]SDK36315.1 hypothetical protein SAMN05421869_115202 [Nonomuraea jiangxiensis]
MSGLTAVALVVVILERWLFTAFATTDQVRVTSLFTALPPWAPAGWLLHLALVVLCFAAGHARATAPWPAGQVVRPVVTFLVAWGGGLVVLLANGFSRDAVLQILDAALGPLTCLIPYLPLWAVPYLAGLAWGRGRPGPELLPPGSRLVVLINRFALPLFLWHPTALVLAALATARLGPIAGLNDSPTGPLWLLARLAWLPVLATVLIGLVALARRR